MSETPSKAKASKPAESKAQASDSSGANQYAIVEASGQQFWLQPNRYYDFDRLEGEVGDKVSLKEVLLMTNLLQLLPLNFKPIHMLDS